MQQPRQHSCAKWLCRMGSTSKTKLARFLELLPKLVLLDLATCVRRLYNAALPWGPDAISSKRARTYGISYQHENALLLSRPCALCQGFASGAWFIVVHSLNTIFSSAYGNQDREEAGDPSRKKVVPLVPLYAGSAVTFAASVSGMDGGMLPSDLG